MLFHREEVRGMWSVPCTHVTIKSGEIRPKLRRLSVSRKIRENSFFYTWPMSLVCVTCRAPGDMWVAGCFLISTLPGRCVPWCPVHKSELAIFLWDVYPSRSPEDTSRGVLVAALHRVSLTQPWPGLLWNTPPTSRGDIVSDSNTILSF